ncbi:MAG: AraC family transcriptional regulator [Lachnospiraceae bacterium]|nr:AraC family transcriptional regulator [Lachnospiraceae bacterium]
MQNGFELIKDDFNPTFLFTWRGIRKENEKYYHNHDFIEIAIILSGQGQYRIDDKIYDVKEGDLLILNPGMKHESLVSNPENPTHEFFIGCTDINFAGMEPNHLDLEQGGPIIHTSPDLRLKLSKICSAMQAEKDVLRPGRYFMLRTYLQQMLLMLIREYAEPIERQEGYSFESVNKKYVVERIIHYFEEHYHEKISLDQIAENMYLSPFYISKIFKSETGDTPIRYLIDIRLDRAKELLETTDFDNVKQIAAKVGYDDAYHFSKLFKKRFGISPSQVKRKG